MFTIEMFSHEVGVVQEACSSGYQSSILSERAPQQLYSIRRFAFEELNYIKKTGHIKIWIKVLSFCALDGVCLNHFLKKNILQFKFLKLILRLNSTYLYKKFKKRFKSAFRSLFQL